MPRQLPWVRKGASSKTQTHPLPAKKQPVMRGTDDDSFFGSILGVNEKGKDKAVDEYDEFTIEPMKVGNTWRTKDIMPDERAESSIPPDLDLEPPAVEYMRTAVSRFDLRDDEWMMVEDEFLETAKLFTKHLHFAEYDKLKAQIEVKKKEAEFTRPVIPGARISFEGATKEKAKEQESVQRRAIRDVFASQTEAPEPDERIRRKSTAKYGKELAHDSDLDDLDASYLPRANLAPSGTTKLLSETSNTISKPTTILKLTPSPSNPAHITKISPTSAKPAPSSNQVKSRAPRPSRATLFDMLDDYKPHKQNLTIESGRAPNLSRPPPVGGNSTTSFSSSKPPNTSSINSTKIKKEQKGDIFDGWGGRSLSKETADRLAKRRAEREWEDKDKVKGDRKAVKADVIPTFLFGNSFGT